MANNNKMDRARNAALALVDGARDGSEFFYIDFDDRVRLASRFTADRQTLESAVRGTVADGGTSLYDALLQGLTLTGEARLPRQALVVISDGADQHSTHTLKEVLEVVRESRIQIYTIGYFSAEEERLFLSTGSRLRLTNGTPVDNPRLALEKIAKESGAESYFPRSDKELDKAIIEINDDLRTQYTLAFYPATPDEKTYHELKVTVRGGRYSVRARPGYGTREVEPAPARTDRP